ncbi:MAG: Radical SAM superfamily protein [Spirochaetes bacterium ADurb.Bin001]|nr:MAG: Radical SAM superfamily protein [Spirochaetes bacterium ADurb.Bin001]
MEKYQEIRELVSRIVPGNRPFFPAEIKAGAIKEKGRKKNYHQYNLLSQQWEKKERLLDTEQINSFLEISLRAAACPMPFNADVWDGLNCPFRCVYCFADVFRASLYTSFFDNPRAIGLRHCNPDYYKQEIDKMLPLRGRDPHGLSGTRKAFAMEIPIRFGIRFEDFTKMEKRQGVSLQLLKYFKEIEYPVMINTKSDLVGEDEYVKALAENPAGAAVHITILTTNEDLTKKIEPGAPSFERRIKAVKTLHKAGVRVVPRIEPFMFLLTDEEDDTKRYVETLAEIGIKHMTFDTYSYSANIPGVRNNFINRNIDFDRIFTAGCDSQKLGSILLEKYINLFRSYGISCSTFDLGNVPSNDQDICCSVGDWFRGGWNYGCTVMAIRFITQNQGRPVTWSMYKDWVYEHGGFLTDALEQEVHRLWNMEGNIAYSVAWGAGMIPVGWDRDGIVWAHLPEADSRIELLESLKAGLKR